MTRGEQRANIRSSPLVHTANSSRPTFEMSENDIKKTTELRISTETDANFNDLHGIPPAWTVPDRDRPYTGYEHV